VIKHVEPVPSGLLQTGHEVHTLLDMIYFVLSQVELVGRGMTVDGVAEDMHTE